MSISYNGSNRHFPFHILIPVRSGLVIVILKIISKFILLYEKENISIITS